MRAPHDRLSERGQCPLSVVRHRAVGELVSILAAAAVAIVASACSSTTDSAAPVTVESGAGALAGYNTPNGPCPTGGPVRDGYKRALDDNDGVMGAVYNHSTTSLDVRFEENECVLAPGQSLAYASGDKTDSLKVSKATPPQSLKPDMLEITLYDPNIGTPFAKVANTARGCEWRNDDLSEGEQWTVERMDVGRIRIERLSDDERIAREWTEDRSSVTDWARIDIHVYSLGEGC